MAYNDTDNSVLAVGELLWDLLPGGAVLGGAPFNFLYRAVSLGCSGRFCSRVGRDARGDEALEIMRQRGLDTGLVQVDAARPTGAVHVSLDGAGTATYDIVPDQAYDRIAPEPALLDAAAGADCVYFGTLALRTGQGRETVFAVLDVAPGIKLYDMNLRAPWYSPELVRGCLERATVAKLNDEEAAWLCRELHLDVPAGEPAAAAAAIGTHWDLEACIVTLGAAGACVWSRTGGMHREPGYAVPVADTVGAGDAFTAGFMAAYLGTRDAAAACMQGVITGAIAAMQHGATVPITPEMVGDFDAGAYERVKTTADYDYDSDSDSDEEGAI